MHSTDKERINFHLTCITINLNVYSQIVFSQRTPCDSTDATSVDPTCVLALRIQFPTFRKKLLLLGILHVAALFPGSSAVHS
jgi:hypothetical protein